ncbi:MAG TPA: substrate-binding domain-containing protein [Burkholderiales bacterium]|nr:substrate-binding domain-containing protein [Burkholderiales bacterium]
MKVRSLIELKRVGLALLLLAGFAAEAAEVKVLAGAALSSALAELGPQFESVTGHKLVIQYGILGALKKRLASDEPFDLAIVPAGLLNGATKQGKIDGATRAAIARVGMAVAVRAGTPKPDIGSVDAFKRALLDASMLTYPPEGAIGVHLAKVLDQLGISEQVKARTKPLKTVELVAPTLAAGEAELGFAPSTVFVGAEGIEMVGPFPPELQNYVQLTAGVGAASAQPDAARELIKHLTSPDAKAVFKVKGFEPTAR